MCLADRTNAKAKFHTNKYVWHTLSDRIGKVVAPHAAVARLSPAEVALIYTMHVSGRIGEVVVSHAAVARSSPAKCTDLYFARGAQEALPMRVEVRPVNWIYRLWHHYP